MRDHSELTGRLRRIEGRHNPLLKELRQAFARGELTASGECATEGFRIIEEALRSGLKCRALFFNESAEPRAARLVPQMGSHVETLLVPDKLFANAVPSQSPQGVAALVRLKAYSLQDVLEAAGDGPLLVIVGVQDPGNLGTILRSAEAFQAKGVLMVERTVSAYNNKAVRASAGSVFRLPMAKTEFKSLPEALHERGFRLVATSSHKGMALHQATFIKATAIFIGNEGAGIDKKLVGKMDELITIPHSPKVESLNAGIAASIILYEAARQRLFGTETRGSGEAET